jgi:uncharacterized protein (TIGR00369 family)
MTALSAEDTLQQWTQQLDAVLASQQSSPFAHAQHSDGLSMTQRLAGKSGLEVMTLWLEGQTNSPRISKTMDFHLVELGDGLAIFQGTPGEQHFNPMGTVHGGWFATLMDSALGCAVHTKLPAGKAYTTSQINMNIVRAAHANTGPLRAVGTVVHMGRQVATSEAKIIDPSGKLYAHATSTCYVFDARG